MNTGSTIFSQLVGFLSHYEFQKCVSRYEGKHKVESFSCWDQYLCMAFAQLIYREGLRDIEACLRVAEEKLYYMGIRSKISRNTLSNANRIRDWRVFVNFGQELISEARTLYANEDFGVAWISTKLSTLWTPRRSTCASRCFLGLIFARTRIR